MPGISGNVSAGVATSNPTISNSEDIGRLSLPVRQERIDKKCRTPSGQKTFIVKPIRLDTASIYECTSVFLKTLSTARGSLQMFCNGGPVPCTFPAVSLLGHAGKRPRKLPLCLVISRSGARIYERNCGFTLHSRAEQGKRAISHAAPRAIKFSGLEKKHAVRARSRSGTAGLWRRESGPIVAAEKRFWRSPGTGRTLKTPATAGF